MATSGITFTKPSLSSPTSASTISGGGASSAADMLKDLEKLIQEAEDIDDDEAKKAVDKFQQELEKLQEKRLKQEQEIAESKKDIEEAQTVRGAAEKAASSAQKVIKATASIASLEAQNDIIDSDEAAGGSERRKRLMEKLRVDQDRTLAAVKDYTDTADTKRTGIGILDGIINEFANIGNSFRVENAVLEQRATALAIKQSNAALTSVANSEALTRRAITDATIKAELAVIDAETTSKLSAQDIANAQTNADWVLRTQQADAASIANYRAIVEARSSEASREQRTADRKVALLETQIRISQAIEAKETKAVQLAIARNELELQTATNPGRIAALNTQNKDLVDRLTANEALKIQFSNSVNIAKAAFGLPPETADSVYYNMTQATPRIREIFAELYASGLKGAGNIVFETPASALAIKNALGADASTPVNDLLVTIEARAAEKLATVENIKAKPGTPEYDALINKTTAEMFAEYDANIKTGDATNPRQAPPMAVLGDMKSVKSLPTYQNVWKETVGDVADPKIIMDLTVNAIAAGTISLEQGAKDIDALYTAAAAHNNTMGDSFRRIGAPEQTSYIVQMQIPNFISAMGFSAFSLARTFGSVPALAGAALKSISGDPTTPVTVFEAVQEEYADRTKYSPGFKYIDLMQESQVLNVLTVLRSRVSDSKPSENTEEGNK
jgi:hypothetical protein